MRVVAGSAGSFGKVSFSFEEDDHDSYAQRGHDKGCVAPPDLASVFSPGHVPSPVQAVFNSPMATDEGSDELRFPLPRWQ